MQDAAQSDAASGGNGACAGTLALGGGGGGADNVLDGNVATVPTLDSLLYVACTGRSKCWRHFAFRYST